MEIYFEILSNIYILLILFLGTRNFNVHSTLDIAWTFSLNIFIF